ncbi:vascular cell adhesion protein 1-like [Oncorhynchus keta]|uniref:vascular cell adhesion protein 1-like n=1 Tax=Oncorhynchus keta TaxID=8018 RepID=UPI0015FB74EF|nr:vascular cell adhesion protein 1-like [Oncorhynchus keta]
MSLLWIVILPVTAFAFHVELKPKSAFFRVGDRQELRCSVKDCNEKVTMSWALLGDKPMFAKIHTSGSESVAAFDPVMTVHDDILLCKVSCGALTKQQRVVVKVYSFPEAPVISGYDHLLLGQSNTLTCEVIDAYPVEHLRLEWLRGDSMLQTDAESVVSTYRFTPTPEDKETSITCRASHDQDGVPDEEKTKETTVSLTVLYAPQNISISELTAVRVGSSLTLSCHAEGNPRPDTQWKAIGPDGQAVIVGQSEELVLTEMTLVDAGQYECVVSNTIGNSTASVNVIVQAPPTNTTITVSPASEVKEGESVTVSCLSDGAPVVRMVLRRLSEDQDVELQSSNGFSTSFTLSSALLADSALYQCQAFNEHGSQKVSALLSVEEYPLEVAMDVGVTAEMGSNLVLSCRAWGCPQPAFYWSSMLDMSVHSRAHTQDSLSQLYLGPLGLINEQAYTCEAKCGSVIKAKHAEVKVFSFPSDPIIENTGPFLEHGVGIFFCSVANVYPASLLQIQWLDGEIELASEMGQYSSELQNVTSTLSFSIGPEDQGRQITCRVSLQMDEVPQSGRERQAVTVLELHYAPRGTTITVSPANEVKEGESVAVSCLSDGVPVGRMVLRRLSEDQDIELQSSNRFSTSFTLSSALLADSALYWCEAFNELGSQRASTYITVKAPPRNTTVLIYPSAEVQEGQNVTICCHSVSFPPPAVVLRKLDNGTELYSPDGNFLLVNLTPNDTGLYQVNVTNDLGYETEIFSINVIEKHSSTSPDWNHVVIPAVCVGIMVTTTGLILDYLRRARRKGFYELAKCKPGSA